MSHFLSQGICSSLVIDWYTLHSYPPMIHRMGSRLPTHVGDENHPAICDQIKERLDLAMLLKQAANIITAGLVLYC